MSDIIDRLELLLAGVTNSEANESSYFDFISEHGETIVNTLKASKSLADDMKPMTKSVEIKCKGGKYYALGRPITERLAQFKVTLEELK